jgi:hypothetical protein
MGLQMPATLAALGPHKILKLSDLFVEAVNILVKEPTGKKKKRVLTSVSINGHLWQGGQDENY